MPDDTVLPEDLNAAVDHAVGLLGDLEQDDDKGAAPKASADPAEDGAGQETDPPAEDPEGESDPPADPASVEAPRSWSKEDQEAWKALPPATQARLADRERARDLEIRRIQDEAANAKKSIDPEKQRLAQQLETAITLTRNFDPALADWFGMTDQQKAELRNTDFGSYLQKKEAAEQRWGQIQAMQAEHARLQGEQRGTVVQAEHQALLKAIPELSDKAKATAFAKEVGEHLGAYGFNPQEIEGAIDHRMLLVVRDAMNWRKGEAARKAAAGKQTKDVPKVQRPGSGDAGAGKAQVAAILKRARAATSTHDQAEAVAALLD